MFSGSFNDKGAINCDACSIFRSETLQVAFYGRLYGIQNNADETGFAGDVAQRYMQYGDHAFSSLDGSFTIILRDGEKTVIVRDRQGTGPQVYYTQTHYASSLMELKQTGCCKDVDPVSLGLFLHTGYIPGGRSAFKDVYKLSAGSMLSHNGETITVKNLFQEPGFSDGIEKKMTGSTLDEYAQQYKTLHAQAISKRIGESRNVGILLSGGYDSGCNLAALRNIYDGEIKSYSIGFKGDNWSELPLARCMSETFGSRHRTYEIDGSEILALPSIVEHLGDPFVEGGLMVNYAAMNLVGGDKPDVILGGDGNDQYFGTSAREVALHYLTGRYGLQPLIKLMYGLLDTKAGERNDKAYRLKFHIDKILNILHGDVFGIGTNRLKDFFRDPSQIIVPHGERSDCSSFESLYNQHAHVTDIGKIVNQVILFKAARMAEMFGNTVAFPYLDTELYNLLAELPIGYKCYGESPAQIAKGNFTAKYLLKYAYKPMLPDAITSRKKQGGFAPMPVFFEDKKRRGMLGDFIMQSSAVREFLRRDTVEHFIRNYEKECVQHNRWFWYRQNQAIQFFNLLTLSVWWEIYVAGKTDVRF